MTAGAGVDFPEERGVVDLLASSRGDALMGWVQSASDDMIAVTAAEDRSRRRVRLQVGEHVTVVWRGPEELRSRPTELVAVGREPQPVWWLRPAGPAARAQRRAWVRAPVAFPVFMSVGSLELSGMTVDISEGGVRVLFNGPTGADAEKAPWDSSGTDERAPAEDAAPGTTGQPVETAGDADPFAVGSVVLLTLWLDGEREAGIGCRAELLRRIRRDDDRLEFSFRFIGIDEKRQDLIRRQVFTGLRLLRQRGLL